MDVKPEDLARESKFWHCAKCGQRLDAEEESLTIKKGAPPACANCFHEVISEMSQGRSMWPAGWFGHASRDQFGVWHSWPIRPTILSKFFKRG